MNPLTSPLLTDLYQLTMLQAYVEGDMKDKAVFEFFVRALPEGRAFLIACGLESCLKFFEDMRFSDAEIGYLKQSGRFSPALISYLSDFRFTGDVYAMPEGTVFFADEPLIRVEAPICEAQLVETRLINLMQFETLIASKAARCILAADGRASLIDFGLRRAHGAEAGLLAARASYIAGFIGTATVLAEPVFGIPIFGTMAHSFIEAHNDEQDAFVDFCLANPNNTTLLIDTYDTAGGARKAVAAAKILAKKGIPVQRVRLDSGDLLALSKEVRRILDSEGFQAIQIFVSGNMDEFGIRDLLAQGAPIDGFGVGTKLDTSSDAPYLECAYKLTEYAGQARMKKSSGKVSFPGRKQVFRKYRKGRMTGDTITIAGDLLAGMPLLEPVMVGGKRLAPARTLTEIADYTREQLSTLPEELRDLTAKSSAYPVKISPALERLKNETEAMLTNS
ncbi:MAG: nicotinate phosphoribosyltransferase [Deltaproteobacteria bacterium]|nr:nicotinate phosphoribosyltransferase [Deltaproteobacteria bacterium]